MERELAVDARCPSCGKVGLRLRTMLQDLPYMGESLITTVSCEACHFKHTDTMVTRQRAPSRHTLRFRGREDLGVRVVRSHSGTYRIPELGFIAEPGEASESFVSNVQGVLDRVRDVLVRARVVLPEEERRQRAEALLGLVQEMREGKREGTLILEDPFGNSQIVSERAEVEQLSPEEASLLRTGVILLDKSEVERG